MNARVKNTLGGRAKTSTSMVMFNPRVIVFLIVLGVFSFGAYITLSGFSGDLKSGNNGGEHVLSKSAVGFGGLLHLLKQNGQTVDISRAQNVRDQAQSQLRIVTMPARARRNNIDDLNIDTPTLIVLPKWQTQRLVGHKGWVERKNIPYPDKVGLKNIKRRLEDIAPSIHIFRSPFESEKISVRFSGTNRKTSQADFYNFDSIQTISGKNIDPFLTTEQGILIGRIKKTNTYILSDPDFLNTMGIANADRAEFAYIFLGSLKNDTKMHGYVFDLSVHGFVKSRNLIKLALTPPFLAATMCLLAMAILGAWQAFTRFGDAAGAKRSFAYGKAGLIQNAAEFIKLAGREHEMSQDYGKLSRKITLEKLNIPAALPEKEKIKRLDTYSKFANVPENWSTLEPQTKAPMNATELMKIAKKLFKWRGDITHERK